MALILKLDGVSKSFARVETNDVTTALAEINLEMQSGQFISLVGTSGCGKSTMLRLIAGLIQPTTGRLTVNGEEITGTSPARGMMFQQHTLFPWLTVEKNISFSDRMHGRHKDKASIDEVNRMLKVIGLEDFRKDYPAQLSGGMQQRVGIARAYCNEPLVMLLDEPFGHLDAQTRYLMQDELTRIWQAEKRTVIFVTNNIEEAVYLADRILVLRNCPTGVKAEYEINLPRPRNYTDPEFLRLRREIDAVVDHTL